MAVLLTTLLGITVTTLFENLSDIISCPINGPFEGEEYWIDHESNTIQIANNDVRLAATIMRKVNAAELFETKLVKIGQAGDNILLGLDTLGDTKPVFTTRIGFQRDTLVEVKKDKAGKLCLYVNQKRHARMFNKMTSVKEFIKTLDTDLQADTADIKTFEAYEAE